MLRARRLERVLLWCYDNAGNLNWDLYGRGLFYSDSSAVERRGCIKYVILVDALFNHKDEIQGYQDDRRMFMATEKLSFHGIADSAKFSDTSNTRCQSHSYAAVEFIRFVDLYYLLLDQGRDVDVKPGFTSRKECFKGPRGFSDSR